MFCDQGFRADGTVNLRGAKIGALVDRESPGRKLLLLDGLTYGDLT